MTLRKQSNFDGDFNKISHKNKFFSYFYRRTFFHRLTQSVWSDVFYVKPELKTTIIERCLLWQQREERFSPVFNLDVQECPCVLDQAIIDIARFHDDPNCHAMSNSINAKKRSINCIHQPQAERCFRLVAPGYCTT